MVGDDHREPRLAADPHGLPDRVEDAPLLVSHVRRVHPAEGRDAARDGDDLGGRGGAGRRVGQPGAEPDAPGAHPFVGKLDHALDLSLGGRPVERPVHHQRTKRAVADLHGDVEGGRSAFELLAIGGEGGEAVPVLPAEEVEGGRRLAAGEGGEAHPAVSGDDGGDALAHLAGHPGVGEDRAVVVGVGVDEAGGDDEPARVDLAGTPRRVEPPDGGDPVAVDGHVGGAARGAGPVDHRSASKEQVARVGIHSSRSPGVAWRRESQPRSGSGSDFGVGPQSP